MILAETIQDRLTKEVGKSIVYDFDIRYLGKWLRNYPQCFPKYMLKENFTPIFNAVKYRWEVHKGHIKLEFNPQSYI